MSDAARLLQVGLVRVTETLIVVLGAAFSMIVIYAIFSRYALGFSITWIEEVVRFLMAWIVFMGLSVVLFHRGHMAMEAVLTVLSPRLQDVLRLVFHILIMIFLAVVVVEGWKLAVSALRQVSPVSGISYFWPYLSLPVGAALGCVQFAFFIADDLKQAFGRRIS